MKRILVLNVFLIVGLFSCNHHQAYNKENQVIAPKLLDVTCYTGNAIAFFDETGPSITFIPVLEKDSNKFKNADVFKSIKGMISINMFVGDYIINKLLASNEKQILNRKICNINKSSTYYIKIWISYKNYKEALHKQKIKRISDSCKRIDIYPDLEPRGEVLNFRIINSISNQGSKPVLH